MTHSSMICRVAAWFVVCLLTTFPCAAYELGPTIQLTQDLSAYFSRVDLAFNSVDNEYIAVWSRGQDVAGQRFTHGGALVGNNLILMSELGVQTDPEVAYNPVDNQYLLTARVQNDPLNVMNGAVGRRIEATGDFIGSRFAVSSAGLEPELVYNAIEHEYFFTGRKFQNGKGIFGQRIGVDGTTIDTAKRLDPPDDPPNDNSARAPNGDLVWNSVDNEYLAVWRLQVVGHAVETRRIGVGNIPLEIPSTIPSMLTTNMQVAFDPLENRYLVAYNRRYTASSADSALLGMFVDAAGVPTGNEMLLSEHVTVEQFRDGFSLEFDPVHRRYLLVSIRDATDLVGRSISASGVPANEFVIATMGERIVDLTVLFNEVNQEFMIAWEADNNRAANNIFARSVAVPEPSTYMLLVWCSQLLSMRARR